MTKGTATIKQTRFIPGKPDAVFDALVYPEAHGEFTGSKATGDPRVGGEFTVWDGYIRGRNLELQKGSKIVQEWETTEWPEGAPPSILEISLTAKDEGTELRMIHSRVPAEQAENYRKGWIDFYWKPLLEYFEKRKRKAGRRTVPPKI